MNSINYSSQHHLTGSSNQYVYTQYHHMVFAICRQYLKSLVDAEDAAQDTFIRVYEKFHQFDASRGDLKSWIAKIAQNTCLMMLRSYKLKKCDELTPAVDFQHTETLENYYDQQRLDELIKGLAPAQEQVFRLYEEEGYDHEEIGDMFGIEESSSRANLCRAKRNLRKACTALF